MTRRPLHTEHPAGPGPEAAAWRGAVCPALLAVFVTVAWLALGSPAAFAQRAPALPPLVQSCPMHPDVVESRPGTCPLCKMQLVPTRLDAAWMCPVHAAVVETGSGSCRLCGRGLVPVTVTLAWTCRGDVNTQFVEPGNCADGSPRLMKRTLRPHGNHNPQHGGQFFMAADNWHHLEGTYPRAGRFRLFLYDDYARPLPAAALQQVQARVVPATAGAARTPTGTPLRLVRDGGYLEANLDHRSWPAQLTAFVRLKPGGDEYRFDFTFTTASIDPTPPAARVTTTARTSGRGPASRSTRRAAEAPPVAAPTPPAPPADVPAPAAEVTTPPPTTIPEIVRAIDARRTAIDALIARGDFGAVWVPAFEAKDLAIELEAHAAHLPEGRRAPAAAAVFALVQAAWHLDAVGDSGSRPEIDRAFTAFTSAVRAVEGSFATP